MFPNAVATKVWDAKHAADRHRGSSTTDAHRQTDGRHENVMPSVPLKGGGGINTGFHCINYKIILT